MNVGVDGGVHHGFAQARKMISGMEKVAVKKKRRVGADEGSEKGLSVGEFVEAEEDWEESEKGREEGRARERMEARGPPFVERDERGWIGEGRRGCN